MTVRVLCDYAHADLWESLEMLFTDRFGWELYRPIGMDWYDAGIWNFERTRLGDQVAKQFLTPWPEDHEIVGHLVRPDGTHPGRFIKLVTLEEARDSEWDLVIATLAENEAGLAAFARDCRAVYGIQIGNQGAPNNFGQAAFVMSSVTLPQVPNLWMPHVFYHQEFSLADFRYEWPPSETALIATRVQCFAQTQEYARFRGLAAKAPGAIWRHYGHCGPRDELWGGDAQNTPEVAEQMRAARVGYHVKRWSDGYGHVIHNWFAVGRPLLTSMGYYTGRDDGVPKLAAPLFEDGVTCFDLGTRSDSEVVDLTRRLLSDDDLHRQISDQARIRFDAVVNFDVEADQIKTMLDGVLSSRQVPA